MIHSLSASMFLLLGLIAALLLCGPCGCGSGSAGDPQPDDGGLIVEGCALFEGVRVLNSPSNPAGTDLEFVVLTNLATGAAQSFPLVTQRILPGSSWRAPVKAGEYSVEVYFSLIGGAGRYEPPNGRVVVNCDSPQIEAFVDP